LVRVWDALVRVAHWTLVACIAAAWFTRGALHDAVGYTALVVLAVRYARFRQFVAGPAVTLAYARMVAARTEPRYLGHNPLGGWMIVALLATVALTAGSGWLSSTDRFWGVAWLQDAHGALADALLVLIGLHLAGVLYTSLRHRENLVRAMLTGRKRAARPGDVLE